MSTRQLQSHPLLKHYADAISHLKLPANYPEMVETFAGTLGKIVVTGLGKSGLIARKLSATLSSIGAPSCFMHAGEAGHGDLGVLQSTDTLITLSHSGESKECMQALRRAKELSCPSLAMTHSETSSMAQMADMCLNYHTFDSEFGPHALAPTTSTCIMLALCDCLAIDIAEHKRMTPASFAYNHPAGTLGLRLTAIKDLCDTPERCPIIAQDASIREAIRVMTVHTSGLALICKNNVLEGVFSDGDLRRCMMENISLDDPVITVATRTFQSLPPESNAYEALKLMERMKITALPITEDKLLHGCINIHQIRRQRHG